jgi:hypothetical protein
METEHDGEMLMSYQVRSLNYELEKGVDEWLWPVFSSQIEGVYKGVL